MASCAEQEENEECCIMLSHVRGKRVPARGASRLDKEEVGEDESSFINME